MATRTFTTDALGSEWANTPIAIDEETGVISLTYPEGVRGAGNSITLDPAVRGERGQWEKIAKALNTTTDSFVGFPRLRTTLTKKGIDIEGTAEVPAAPEAPAAAPEAPAAAPAAVPATNDLDSLYAKNQADRDAWSAEKESERKQQLWEALSASSATYKEAWERAYPGFDFGKAHSAKANKANRGANKASLPVNKKGEIVRARTREEETELAGLKGRTGDPEGYPAAPERTQHEEDFNRYFAEVEQEKKQARRNRWLQVGEGLQGLPVTERGITEAQGMGLRLEAGKVLALLDKNRSELEQQGLRWSYQTQAANAQVITALGGIVQQDLAGASSQVAVKAQMENAKNIEGHKRVDARLARLGFAQSALRNDKTILKLVHGHSAAFKGGRTDHLIDYEGSEADDARANLLTKLKTDLGDLTPHEGAIYLDMIRSTYGFDLNELFGVQIKEGEDGKPTVAVSGWNSPHTKAELWRGYDKTDIHDLIEKAAAGRAKAEYEDTQGFELREKIYTRQATLGRHLSATGRNALALMLQYADRQKFRPGDQLKVDTKGRFVVTDPEAPETEAGEGEEAADRPPQTRAEKELIAVIEDLKGGNPSARSLRRKRSMMASPDIIKLANEKFEGDREAAWQSLADQFQYRQTQTDDAADIRTRQAKLENPHAYSWWDVRKAELGKIFGAKRTRFQDVKIESDLKRQKELEQLRATTEAAVPKAAARVTAGATVPKGEKEDDAPPPGQ